MTSVESNDYTAQPLLLQNKGTMPQRLLLRHPHNVPLRQNANEQKIKKPPANPDGIAWEREAT
jgi:hypothetical protein